VKKAGFGNRGFTLVEILIAAAIIAVLAAVAIPGFIRARKRSQATQVLNSLRMIDAAVDQYAVETHKIAGAPVTFDDWKLYLKNQTALYQTGADIFGHSFGTQYVDQVPVVPDPTKAALSDVADATFWSPYQ
jgi:prepilin-type N-terminal cleavage/methylation domain-containing protein